MRFGYGTKHLPAMWEATDWWAGFATEMAGYPNPADRTHTVTETCRVHPEEEEWGGCLECPTCTDCGHYFTDKITDKCSNCGRQDD